MIIVFFVLIVFIFQDKRCKYFQCDQNLFAILLCINISWLWTPIYDFLILYMYFIFFFKIMAVFNQFYKNFSRCMFIVTILKRNLRTALVLWFVSVILILWKNIFQINYFMYHILDFNDLKFSQNCDIIFPNSSLP